MSPPSVSTSRQYVPSPWQPDLGDGRYKNPVLFADYADPDVIRVGDDFWMIASSFSQSPGLPILHSRDLVNWALVGHALPRLVPESHFGTPRHGGGVWAPAIRYRNDKYRIYYPDPDFGIYCTTSDHPSSVWSAPVPVLEGRGLIDPCPFWDDDGSGWLIHGWAKSRSGICNRLTLHQLGPDGLSVHGGATVVIDGNAMPGWHTIEGPKLYRRGEYYYIFAPAGGVTDGYQAVFRSRRITGPYESRIVLAQGNTSVNGPHQGAWVDTPSGENWFLHFQDHAAYGRLVHLQPMRWRPDGWPEIGDRTAADEPGTPVLIHDKPSLPVRPPVQPPVSDDFRATSIGPQWQWQANPQPSWFDRSSARGLHLACVPRQDAASLWSVPNLLLQKFPAPAFTATTRIDFRSDRASDSAGLIVFGADYAWIGIRQVGHTPHVVACECLDADETGVEREIARLPLEGNSLYLRVAIDPNAKCQFSFGTDGTNFSILIPDFRARPGKWVGAKVGLFASSESPLPGAGYARFEWFEVA